MLEIKQINIKTIEKTKESVRGKLLLNPWVQKALEAKQELAEASEEEEEISHDNNETVKKPIAPKHCEKRHLQMCINVSISTMQKLKM